MKKWMAFDVGRSAAAEAFSAVGEKRSDQVRRLVREGAFHFKELFGTTALQEPTCASIGCSWGNCNDSW